MKFSRFGALRLSPLLAVAALPLVLGYFSQTRKSAPPAPAVLQAAPASAWRERSPSPAVAATGSPVVARRRERQLEQATRVRPVASADIRGWREGDSVVLPLFDGGETAGVVRLVRSRADGGVLLGGELSEGGSFTLATEAGAGAATEGLILPARGNRVYRVAKADDGGALLAELPRSAVLCATLPRPPDPAAPRAAAIERAGGSVETQAVAYPLLESRPGAEPVLYLDFDGQTVNDPVWNGGRTIEAAPSGLSADEVRRVWRKVAEDYRTFNINVTTDAARYAEARPMQRMRCIVTPTREWYGQVGGVALIFSWRDAGAGAFAEDVPCWVFSEPGVMLADDVALAVSHEAGHTFGLYHDGLRGADGTTPPEGDYYQGHGTGPTAWGPIMGAPYGKPLIQWSRGDYAVGARVANNPQDDLALIGTIENHLGRITDRRADTRADAGRLALAPDGVTVDHVGVIDAPGAESWLLVATGSGVVNLRLAPEHDDLPDATNFDGALRLTTLGGAVLATADATGTPFPQLSANLPAGVYILRVRSVGEGSAASGGYSDYGSIGTFRVRGTIQAPAAVAPVIGGAARFEGRAGAPVDYLIEAAGAGLNYSATGLPPGLVVGADGRVTGQPDAHGVWRATVHASNAHGAAQREVVFALAGASLAETLDAPDLVFTTGGEREWRSVAEPDAPHGGSHARSGDLVDNMGESWIETKVQGPGRLSWRWKSSCERDYDVLHASVDGTLVAQISGERPWEEHAVEVPAGAHVIRWCYDKDDYLSEFQDAAWLDDVRWAGAFETWAESAALSGPGAAAEADPDGDGVPNLLEYAFGRAPGTADGLGSALRVAPTTDPAGGGALEVAFERPASRDDLRYVVEVSSDLVNWTRGHAYGAGAANGGGMPTVELAREALGGGGERIRVRDATRPGPDAPRRFIRVRVERP